MLEDPHHTTFHDKMKSRAFTTLIWLVFVGCATAEGPPAGDTRQSVSAEAVIVNHGWSDVRVYVSRGGSRDLLGFVTSGSIQRFALDPDMVRATSLKLVADPVGSTTILESDLFVLRSDGVVEWTIRQRPENSSIVVY